MKKGSDAVTAPVREASKPDWMTLVRSYTMEDRRKATQPPLHPHRRRDDELERSSTESDD